MAAPSAQRSCAYRSYNSTRECCYTSRLLFLSTTKNAKRAVWYIWVFESFARFAVSKFSYKRRA